MKDKILPILLASTVLISCSTYKSGQTPDDVYYSPTKEVSHKEEKEEEKYEEDMTSRDDQYLKMKVKDRDKWSTIDDNDYWYDSRYNHCNCNCNHTTYNYNPKRPYYYGGGVWYNPSYPIVYYKNPKVYTGNTGKTNVTSYSNPRYNNNNNSNSGYNPKTGNSNSNNNGSLLNRAVRVFSGSSSSSSSSSSGTSSNAGGRSGGTDSKGSSATGGRSKGN